MSRRLKLDINESVEELKTLLQSEKDTRKKERIHALYLYQTGQSIELIDLGQKLTRHSTTIGGWFRIYRTKGLDGLLNIKQGGGKSCMIILFL